MWDTPIIYDAGEVGHLPSRVGRRETEGTILIVFVAAQSIVVSISIQPPVTFLRLVESYSGQRFRGVHGYEFTH
jgi:hypothetical protein